MNVLGVVLFTFFDLQIGVTHNGFELGSQRDVLDLTFGGYFKRIRVVPLL